MRAHAVEISAGADAPFELRVNDVPVAAKSGREDYAAALPIESEVVPGANRVTLVVGRRRDGPPAAAAATAKMRISAKVLLERSTDHGARVDTSSEVLAEAEWNPVKAGETQVMLPHRIELSFSSTDTARPVWMDTAPIAEASVRDAALAATRALAALLAAGEFERFAEASRLKYQDMARAFPAVGGPERMQAIDAQQLRMAFGQPGAALAPIDGLAPRVRVHAGRLVEPVGGDGLPLLRLTIPGRAEPIPLKLMFAQIDGRLVPVR